jgi:hypothetical protein
MKILRVHVPLALVEKIFRTGLLVQTERGLIPFQWDLPRGAKLREAQTGEKELFLYFECEGEGTEERIMHERSSAKKGDT